MTPQQVALPLQLNGFPVNPGEIQYLAIWEQSYKSDSNTPLPSPEDLRIPMLWVLGDHELIKIDLFRLFHGATDNEESNLLSDFSKARTELDSPFLSSKHDFHPSARMPVLYATVPLNDTYHYSHAHSHIDYLMSLKNMNPLPPPLFQQQVLFVSCFSRCLPQNSYQYMLYMIPCLLGVRWVVPLLWWLIQVL